MTGENVPALIVALGALLTGAAALWQQRRGVRTDNSSAASTLTNAASGLVNDLRLEISRLREAVADLQHLVSALESEIVTLGGDPSRIRFEVNELRRRRTDVPPDVKGTPI